MQISNFLEPKFPQVAPNILLSSFCNELEKYNFLVVVENHTLLGVVILRSTQKIENKFALECMDTEILSFEENESAGDVLSQMQSAGCDYALVKRLGVIIGVVL